LRGDAGDRAATRVADHAARLDLIADGVAIAGRDARTSAVPRQARAATA